MLRGELYLADDPELAAGHTIVAAGAVVTKDLPADVVAVGVPAQVRGSVSGESASPVDA